MSLFPASATAPCNQHRVHQHVGIFPRSKGEMVTRRTQRASLGHTERGGDAAGLISVPVTPEEGATFSLSHYFGEGVQNSLPVKGDNR